MSNDPSKTKVDWTEVNWDFTILQFQKYNTQRSVNNGYN